MKDMVPSNENPILWGVGEEEKRLYSEVCLTRWLRQSLKLNRSQQGRYVGVERITERVAMHPLHNVPIPHHVGQFPLLPRDEGGPDRPLPPHEESEIRSIIFSGMCAISQAYLTRIANELRDGDVLVQITAAVGGEGGDGGGAGGGDDNIPNGTLTLPNFVIFVADGPNQPHEVGLNILRDLRRDGFQNWPRSTVEQNAWLARRLSQWKRGVLVQYRQQYLTINNIGRKLRALMADGRSQNREFHSGGQGGGEGEDLPSHCEIVRSLDEYQRNSTSTSRAQEQRRVQNREVERSTMEAHAPLGGNSNAEPRSQVASQNASRDRNEGHLPGRPAAASFAAAAESVSLVPGGGAFGGIGAPMRRSHVLSSIGSQMQMQSLDMTRAMTEAIRHQPPPQQNTTDIARNTMTAMSDLMRLRASAGATEADQSLFDNVGQLLNNNITINLQEQQLQMQQNMARLQQVQEQQQRLPPPPPPPPPQDPPSRR